MSVERNLDVAAVLSLGASGGACSDEASPTAPAWETVEGRTMTMETPRMMGASGVSNRWVFGRTSARVEGFSVPYTYEVVGSSRSVIRTSWGDTPVTYELKWSWELGGNCVERWGDDPPVTNCWFTFEYEGE